MNVKIQGAKITDGKGEFFVRDITMIKGLQNGMFQLTCVLALCAVFGCTYEGGDGQAGGVNQPQWQPVSKDLVSPKQLINSDLEIVWQDQLPIKQGETLEKLVILEDKIYVLSNRNFIVALDRNNGSNVFSRFVAETGFPVIGLDQYQNEVFTIEGGKLLEMNFEKGADISVTPLAFVAACPAVRNNSFFYIAGTDRRIRAFRAADKVKLFEVAAEDDSVITSVVADENFVIFATDTGRCVSFAANASKYLWKFNADAGIAGPAVKNGDSVFFASKDTHIYRIERATGKFVWKCPMGAILEKGPDVTQKCVYQYVPGKGFAAIDRENGKILWRLPEGIAMIAEAGDKTYVAARGLGIVVMDNIDGKKLSGINIPGVSKYAVNVTDSKIYIADNMGRIACLKPTK